MRLSNRICFNQWKTAYYFVLQCKNCRQYRIHSRRYSGVRGTHAKSIHECSHVSIQWLRIARIVTLGATEARIFEAFGVLRGSAVFVMHLLVHSLFRLWISVSSRLARMFVPSHEHLYLYFTLFHSSAIRPTGSSGSH